MANQFYPISKTHFAQAEIDLIDDTIKVILVDSEEYTFLPTHETISDVPVGGIISTGTLASKTLSDGVFDAADVTLTGVAGDTSEYLIIYKDSGTPATSWLIAFYDTATLLPVTPNGGNIVIQWSNSSTKIFEL